MEVAFLQDNTAHCLVGRDGLPDVDEAQRTAGEGWRGEEEEKMAHELCLRKAVRFGHWNGVRGERHSGLVLTHPAVLSICIQVTPEWSGAPEVN